MSTTTESGSHARLEMRVRYQPPVMPSRENAASAPKAVGSSEEHTVAVLIERLHVKCIEPALKYRTSKEFGGFVRYIWPEFDEMLTSVKGVLSATSEFKGDAEAKAKIDAALLEIDRAVLDRLEQCARAAAGADAGLEVNFARQTYLRAMKLALKLDAMSVPPELRDRDRAVCFGFHLHSKYHVFGALTVLAMSPGVARVVADAAIEMMRWGGMMAYSAAREALDLRTEPVKAGEPSGDSMAEDQVLADEGLADSIKIAQALDER